VATPLVELAPAKINLTLRVLGRRADGYHELASLVAFADLADTLTLQPGDSCTLDVTGPFAARSGPGKDNLVLKAAAALRQRIDGLRAGHFQLAKNIPVAAGIGGGSADAAAALRLLARANSIALDDPRLGAAALSVGADVPVCLDPRPRLMQGIGERLSPPLALPFLPAVLVNPGVPLATRDVFAKFAALVDYIKGEANDLTPAAVACVPAIADILAALEALPGALLARMSGSGASCFALFATRGEAAAAAWMLQSRRPEWWVSPVTIGAARPLENARI
jgi:4-diphosphocytidyl-2-C-methyl-D-erythritol kinase